MTVPLCIIYERPTLLQLGLQEGGQAAAGKYDLSHNSNHASATCDMTVA
jgi:hypothetical protein